MSDRSLLRRSESDRWRETALEMERARNALYVDNERLRAERDRAVEIRVNGCTCEFGPVDSKEQEIGAATRERPAPRHQDWRS